VTGTLAKSAIRNNLFQQTRKRIICSKSRPGSRW
jgi:hypothetical protein